MSGTSLIDQLAAHRTVGGVARRELEWLVAHGHIRELAAGDVLTSVTAGVVEGLYLLLSGRLSIHLDRGAGPRKIMEWRGGDLTGMLPYSRLRVPPAAVIAEEPTTLLMVDREHIDAMPRECPELTTVAVHVMLDRARMFTSSELLDEKLVSLGRLAAGLAHELNNPASAMVRNAATITAALDEFDLAVRRFSALCLPDAVCAEIQAIRDDAAATAGAPLSSIETADREDALAEWLASRHLPDAHVDRLADAGLTPVHLQRMADAVGLERVPLAIERLAAEHTARRVAADIGHAAVRIHELVAAVKRFTYMDQAIAATPMHLGQGLADTITMLRSKARERGVELALAVGDDLPLVDAYGGELNQVWTNLVDNAIDATPRGGRIGISARRDGPTSVVVTIKDTGRGIPAEIQPRIFDPFFTTKGVGDGTGLGLDIARRLVARHRGAIDFTTSGAGTEFRVTLPAASGRF